MNKELVSLLLQLGVGVVIIMIFIVGCTLLTPKIAKLIEKRLPPKDIVPERVENAEKDENPPTVQGPYDAQQEDYDLNNKIYNTDIYGVDFKNGKEK